MGLDALVITEMQKIKALFLTDNPRDICIFANHVNNIVAVLQALHKTNGSAATSQPTGSSIGDVPISREISTRRSWSVKMGFRSLSRQQAEQCVFSAVAP